MAEALLRRRLSEAEVTSVGLLPPGHEVSGGSVRAMAARGLDIAAHRSKQMEAAAVRDADLVIGMARMHVREAVVLVPGALGRSFTLPELVRRGEAVGPADDDLATWLVKVGTGRVPADLLGDGGPDDIPDPIGLPDAEYERTAVLLEDLVDRLGDLIGKARPSR
jgi:protein-tyrosine phosphatase